MHDLEIVARGYDYYESQGRYPLLDEVAHSELSFEQDIKKFAKQVARQRGFILGEQD